MAMVVFGAAGGLGQALTQRLQEVYPQQQIIAVTRQPLDNRLPGVRYTQLDCYDDETLARWAEDFKNSATLEGVVSTIGMLHDDDTFPEKQLSELHSSNLEKLFHVNAVIPMLVLKHCQPLFDKNKRVFCTTVCQGGQHRRELSRRLVQLPSVKSGTQYAVKNCSDRIKANPQTPSNSSRSSGHN